MTSSVLPNPTDAELLAWLNGDNALSDHIAQCPACQARAQALRDEEQFLSANLYRVDCPSAHELGEYELGMLPKFQLSEITGHVAHCPQCRQELATLREFFATVASPRAEPAVGEQIRVVVATLVRDLRAGWQGMGGLHPAMASMRGEQSGPQIYEAGDCQLAIEFQEDPGNPGQRALFGLLIGDEEPSSFEVQLWLDDALVAHAPVDDLGNFSFSGLQPGNYEMKLIRPQLAIHLNDISV